MMPAHDTRHDPIVEHATCLVCNATLHAAFVQLADLPLGPNGVGVLVDQLRQIAGELVSRGAAA